MARRLRARTALAAGSTARGTDGHGSWRRPTPVRRLPSNNPSWIVPWTPGRCAIRRGCCLWVLPWSWKN